MQGFSYRPMAANAEKPDPFDGGRAYYPPGLRLKFQRYECLDFESFERENTGDGAGFDVQYVAM